MHLFVLYSLLFLSYVVACEANKGTTAATGSSSSSSSSSLSRPILTTDNAWKLPIDTTSCSDLHLLQLKRAVTDVDRVVTLAIATLLHHPSAPVVQKYFGDAAHREADLVIPIGLLTRLQHGSKSHVMLQCESSPQSSNSTCTTNKQASAEGGYALPRHRNGSTTIMLCARDFSAGTSTASFAREFLEDICQDDWTLDSSTPNTYWAASLVSLLMQVPQLSAPQMHATQHAYANVLDTARREPQEAAHSIYTYLYMLLDIFARKHHKGGCPGFPSGRVHE